MGLFKGNKDKQYEKVITDLNKTIENYKEKINTLNQLISKENKNGIAESKMLNIKNNNDFILHAGRYVGGENIPIGTYDLLIVSGTGIIETKSPIKQFFRLESDPNIRKERNWSDRYSGFKVTDDCVVEISESAKIRFTLTKPISYDEEYKKYIEKRDGIKQEIEYLEKLRDSKKVKIGDIFVLKQGTYYGGKTIPVGIYNLRAISGSSMIETNRPKIWFNIGTDEGYFDKEYVGLEIKKDTVLKISNKCEIEFCLMIKPKTQNEIEAAKEKAKNEYEFEKQRLYSEFELEKEKAQKSLAMYYNENENIKAELKILNDDAIEKYYIFSDYEGITSQDCKNKLTILKTEEKGLRESGEDVKILNTSEKEKLIERSIRQILRNFNADCDNQIMNISLKNIDVVRNRIQKSYDTLNKLYSVDGVALSEKILELKLEQATLLYTYELKYQQEKDIQRAIKEQMIEEAKAEREIQEQKKKIEKDLQQHLGEVNRLMKYMQKAQMDAERQLYMDKIKELEDKIKSLEADKETVLEREANAKAGFVYIISNIGSFGEDIYKIGMTRRLEPMDRVRELSSASVPFEFDVHAMIFSSDAPELETMLHRHFADRAVNKINPRKEFYKVSIDEIEKIVKENYNDTVKFTKIPVAAEYRQSLELEKSGD